MKCSANGAGGFKELVIPQRTKQNQFKLMPTMSAKVVTLKTSTLPNSDSDDEVQVLCPQCQLPIGDFGYADNKRGAQMHGECKAQLLLQDAKNENELRMKKDVLLKKTRRAKYDLGWKINRVPSNLNFANKLDCCPIPQSMCGVVWQNESKKVSVVATMDQSTSVNLEYLSFALQVRRKEGREPLFSLDPKDTPSCPPNDREKLWQLKRFEPAWLAGTSVGEVMFQADYHLKELSMGEHAQPVVGMKSCFEFSQEEGLLEKDWHGREWFVVNKAEIQLSENNLMIPLVKIGVEAREQVNGPDGMQDKKITCGNHPLVKYADAFTHYFDLIAERKSVVYHLRELAKASVLAKFFVECEANLDQSWYNVASTVSAPSFLEIPQTWNEHVFTELQVSDGQIFNGDETKAKGMPMYGIYGGVEFGLDRLGRVPSVRVAAVRAPSLSARMIAARTATTEFAIPGAGVRPQGVDLDLGRFDLSTIAEAGDKAPAGNWIGNEFLGTAFWSKISGPPTDEDKSLLKDVFNPHLCDRRADGDIFVPPDTSFAHVSSLRALVKEETKVQQERKHRFFSIDFEMGNCGPLYPASWAPSLGVAPGHASGNLPGEITPGNLHARPEYRDEAFKLLNTVAPAFDKCAEDGMRFRIYKVGSLEIRTTQDHEGEEVIGAVFSSEPAVQTSGAHQSWSTVAQTDQIIKAIEYVENLADGAHYYVVLKTEQGDSIVTEKLIDGMVTWSENPENLEIRNSLAKVFRTTNWHGEKITVHDLKSQQTSEIIHTGLVSQSDCKHYAHCTALRVVPAREKAWAVLTKQEICAAKQLGICSGREWDKNTGKVWQLTWPELTGLQHEAARALGLGKAQWARKGQKSILCATWEKNWTELTKVEQQAAKILGIDGANLWDEAPWGKMAMEPGNVWEKSWAQLTEPEREAAQQLGVVNADAWDELAWIPGGAWERKWSQLTQAEQQAAKQLDITAEAVWNKAFGNPDKRGRELEGIWENSWAQLPREAREAAKQLGIAGAGAWDKSNSKASWQKKWARQTEDEQKASIERWLHERLQGPTVNSQSH